MKREILCSRCAPRLAEVWLDSYLPARLALIELDANECARFELGALRRPIVCDHCNAELAAGVEAWCVSLWSTRAGIPYDRWEPEYIVTGGVEP